MSETDPFVRDVLDRAAPTPEQPGDWDDVLRRVDSAPAADPRRGLLRARPSRRGWYALAAAAALAAALAVSPAFGVGERVLDLFRGSPAPEDVREGLGGFDPPAAVADLFAGPDVIEDEARGVIELQTSLGPARLWAAPTRSGGWCMAVEGPSVVDESGVMSGSGSATCNATGGAPAPLEYGSSEHGEGAAAVTLVEGHARDDVASLAVELGDGSTLPVEIVDGFFLFELPDGAVDATLVARNEEGRALQRGELFLEPPTEDEPPVPSTRKTTKLFDIETRVGRATMWKEEPTPPGERCYALEFSGTSGGACGGGPIDYWLETPLSPEEPPVVVLVGSVGPRVARLELGYQDGKRVVLPLVEGYFLHEVRPEHWKEGRLPSLLVARDRDGRVVARERVERRRF